jgi:hypothetical protein
MDAELTEGDSVDVLDDGSKRQSIGETVGLLIGVGLIVERSVGGAVGSTVDTSMDGCRDGILDGLELPVPVGREVGRPSGALVGSSVVVETYVMSTEGQGEAEVRMSLATDGGEVTEESTLVAESGPFSPIYIVSMYDNGKAVGVLDNVSFESSSLSVTGTGGPFSPT